MKYLVVVVILMYSEHTYACGCAHLLPVKSAQAIVAANYERASSVTVAVAEWVVALGGYEITRFSELRSWKGDHGKHFYYISFGHSCSVDFDEGETYLLFGRRYRLLFFTAHVCGRTRAIERAEESIAILDQLTIAE